jgi:predicted nucleotide-binding protein
MPRVITEAEVRSNIERLRRRFVAIEALDTSSLSHYDPKVDALQASLDDALQKAFRGANNRYNRYRRTINWAAEIPSVGVATTVIQYCADVKKGKEEVLTMLSAAIEVLEEELTEHRQTEHPNTGTRGGVIFIGHGRSPVWRELKDFLKDTLNLKADEFSNVPTAGIATSERLSEMLKNASLAFIVMTAEDEQPDGRMRARENVVHEIGLFQGRLGFKRAIVILEDGCEEFSNIHGIGQIRFPKGDIRAKFEEVRKVLEREGQLR